MTKPLQAIILPVLMVSACLVAMINQSWANSEHYGIEVRGQGSILVEPNNFMLSVAIIEQGRSIEKMRVVVDSKSEQVVQAAKQLGVEGKDINSASISLQVIDETTNLDVRGVEVNHRLPNQQRSKVYVGVNSADNSNNNTQLNFQLTRRIIVTFTDIKNYDRFLSQITKIGVGHISPLAMSVNDSEGYYQQALAQAISKAELKAQKMAQQSKRTLGKIVYLKELSSNHYAKQASAPMMSTNNRFSHSSQVGQQVISASVLVKYSLK